MSPGEQEAHVRAEDIYDAGSDHISDLLYRLNRALHNLPLPPTDSSSSRSIEPPAYHFGS